MMRHQGEVEHRLTARAIARRHIFHDLLVGLTHVAVCIDNAPPCASSITTVIITVGFPVRACFHEITSTLSLCAYSHRANRIVNERFERLEPLELLEPLVRDLDRLFHSSTLVSFLYGLSHRRIV